MPPSAGAGPGWVYALAWFGVNDRVKLAACRWPGRRLRRVTATAKQPSRGGRPAAYRAG